MKSLPPTEGFAVSRQVVPCALSTLQESLAAGTTTCSSATAECSIGADRPNELPNIRSTYDKQQQQRPMKTKRTRSLEPAVVTIGQVCFLLLMMMVVPF